MSDRVKKLICFFFAAFLLFPAALAQAQDTEALNAGFVSGLWYSQTPFFTGDQIRIYSGIQNQSGYDLIGKVQFFDGDNLIGESDFSVINGRLVEQWMDWEVTAGEHAIYVALSDTKKTEAGQEPQPVSLAQATSQVDRRFVDIDTDGDRIGDSEDEDDDNDGLSDEEEIEQGTDPLVAETDDVSADPNEDSSQSAGERAQETVGSALDKVDEFAGDQKTKIDERRAQIRGEEGSGQATTTRQLKLAGLSLLSVILGNKILFYLGLVVFLYILWKIFRWWRR